MEISRAKCPRHKTTPVIPISVVKFVLVSAVWVRERLITVSYFYTYFSIMYVSVYENKFVYYLNIP